jgi:hypothetical protein
MDQITQQNAASAEESASASGELSAQAESMNRIVSDLVGLVNGSDSQMYTQDHIGNNFSKRAVKKQHSENLYHQIADDGKNCWEVKKCGRIPGGDKAKELGICPAYPNGGKICWKIAGTFCGGKVQGFAAQKLDSCTKCDFYKKINSDQSDLSDTECQIAESHTQKRSIMRKSSQTAKQLIPFDEDNNFSDFDG